MVLILLATVLWIGISANAKLPEEDMNVVSSLALMFLWNEILDLCLRVVYIYMYVRTNL